MSFLEAARDILDHYLPGLDKRLAEVPLDQLEQPGSAALLGVS